MALNLDALLALLSGAGQPQRNTQPVQRVPVPPSTVAPFDGLMTPEGTTTPVPSLPELISNAFADTPPVADKSSTSGSVASRAAMAGLDAVRSVFGSDAGQEAAARSTRAVGEIAGGMARDVVTGRAPAGAGAGAPFLASLAQSAGSAASGAGRPIAAPTSTPARAASAATRPANPVNPFGGNPLDNFYNALGQTEGAGQQGGVNVDQIFEALIMQESGGRVGIEGPPTPYGRAYGLGQVLDSTGRGIARNLGIPWRPDLMRATTPEGAAYQRQIARAYFNEALRETGGNIREALMYYHGGPNRELWGPRTRNYAASVLNRVQPGSGGVQADFVNAFDPRFFQGAINEINNAERAAMTPTSTNVEMAPLPVFPDAPELPTRDFTEQREIIDSMKPEGDSEEDVLRMQRRGWLQGMAQGLLSLGEDAHAGRVLAAVGAGAMAGRQAADDEVQARADRFDEQMRQWNMLRLQGAQQESEQAYNEALAQVEATYNHNAALFQHNMQIYNARNSVRAENGQLIVTRQTDNGVVVETNPIRSMLAPQFAMQRAQVLQAAGQAEFQATAAEAALTNQLILSNAMTDAQVQAQTGNFGTGAADGQLTSAAMLAHDVFRSGAYVEMLAGDAEFQRRLDLIDTEIQRSASAGMTGNALASAREDQVIALITEYMLNNPALAQQAARSARVGAATVRRQRDEAPERTVTTRERRGNQTTTTREVFE